MHIKVCSGMVEGGRVNGVGGPITDDKVHKPMIKSMVTNQEDNWGDVLRVPRV